MSRPFENRIIETKNYVLSITQNPEREPLKRVLEVVPEIMVANLHYQGDMLCSVIVVGESESDFQRIEEALRRVLDEVSEERWKPSEQAEK